MKPVFYTAAELSQRGSGAVPPELISTTHLIYSSPATLAFNSPGAEGYGVKRAGLAVPGSVMLIVSPGCCGRNTSAISRMPGYEDRFFYLTMDETDLVTGRHLKKIPKAVAELCGGLEAQGKKPRVVMICITCVDALLGTDMERICRRAQEEVPGVRVQPCYMYALTREGRKPPMVHVRQSIYELLEPRRKKASSVNLLGYFAPLRHSELPDILRQAGVRKVRQIGTCRDYDEFQEMAEANFNLVLNPEARPAAYDLQERLGIPFIEIARFYQIDRIEAQYAALGRVLQTAFEDSGWKSEARSAIDAFRRAHPEAVFSVGEAMNGNPFELACALVREGFRVREIFGTVNSESYVWLDLLAKLSPETRIYSNLHPTMLHYTEQEAAASGVTVCIGRDAGWYHPDLPNVQWITDVQPFGYQAVTGLFEALLAAMEEKSRGSYSPDVTLGGSDSGRALKPVREEDESAACAEPVSGGDDCRLSPDGGFGSGSADAGEGSPPPKGFRRFTTPFAPDQSGAVSVLYDMGGICVICDAGGCTGNICGFDEPRWFGQDGRSAVFSAGLRDMDAILGRDDRLVEKLALAAEQIPAEFASIVGTPVPAVIATDYRALCRMAEKKTGLPVLAVDTDGMDYYDKGLEKTYLALLETFCRPSGQRPSAQPASEGSRAGIGVWGFSPLDFAGILSEEELRTQLKAQGYDEVICCGAHASVQDLGKLPQVQKNIVLSPAGTGAARWLEKNFGTPWEYCIPSADGILQRVLGEPENRAEVPGSGRERILIVHQDVLARTLGGLLRDRGLYAEAAGFFMEAQGLDPLPGSGKIPFTHLREEMDLRALVWEKGFTCVIADRSLAAILEGCPVRLLHLPHFAVSGEQSRR